MMAFSEELNEMIKKVGCTGKQLSAVSGVSDAVISRYRTGERIPDAAGEQVPKLARGIAAVAAKNGISGFAYETVLSTLLSPLFSVQMDSKVFAKNFDSLVTVLEINMTELSRVLNFDSSYLSRIRSGNRKPADISAFADGVCRYIIRRYCVGEKLAVIAELIGVDKKILTDPSVSLEKLSCWLMAGKSQIHDYMGDFLKKLDEFDLDEYIRAIHFDELKVPTLPFQLASSKNYYGLNEMKQGELDFFKSTVLSKSCKPVFMCSDMPMEDLAQDLDFGKKWMFAIAVMLKKGLHLNIIHNINRPFKELMLGLESWIPIYMTGQVSPFYFKGVMNSVYCHINYVSGAAALSGECIDGFHGNGKYYLTKNREEVAYYQQKSDNLLAKALPLMEIYRKENENIFNAFISANLSVKGHRHSILSTLPIYTVSDELLARILSRNSIVKEDILKITEYVKKRKEYIKTVLDKNSITDEVVPLTEKEYCSHPMALSLSGLFYDKEIYCTYSEYNEHLALTRMFAEQNKNYKVLLNHGQPFRNIEIVIYEKNAVLISKNKAPVIHFVIRHQKMLHALENFIVPVNELEKEG